MTPYSFSPFNTLIASIASGIGLPPLMSTPSISKAKAKESAVGTSAGVIGDPGVAGELEAGESPTASSSRFIAFSSFLAVSIEAAKPPWCDFALWSIILSGTTTTGPPLVRSSFVAVIEERRRSPGRCAGGDSNFDDSLVGAMVVIIWQSLTQDTNVEDRGPGELWTRCGSVLRCV